MYITFEMLVYLIDSYFIMDIFFQSILLFMAMAMDEVLHDGVNLTPIYQASTGLFHEFSYLMDTPMSPLNSSKEKFKIEFFEDDSIWNQHLGS